jgi:predicted SnoaL-like aldol condensation-catalyzing enzyme
MTRKETAVSFLQLASSGKPRQAFERYIHPRFHHHNPYFAGDGESLLAGMEASAQKFPNKTLDVVRTMEDGDLVAVHGRVRLAPDMDEVALIHIFRFDGNLIVEKWEAGQPVPKESPNRYGMF